MVKVPCPCMWCQTKFEQPCGHIVWESPTEKNAIEVVCPHSTRVTFVVNQGFRFELWAEEALVKYYEGDFALSVSSMFTALERFNEIFIKWSLLRSGVGKSQIEQFWKEVSNASVKQLGAVSFARALELRRIDSELPSLPSNSDANFRNDVVHGGYFPSSAEAEKHLTRILTYIFGVLNVMKEDSENLDELTLWEVSRGYEHAQSEANSRRYDAQNYAIGTLAFPYRLARHNDFNRFVFSDLIEATAIANRLK